jgi:hypothetical protein
MQGYTQGYILDPLLFIIYINNIANLIGGICRVLAIDTSLVIQVKISFKDCNY